MPEHYQVARLPSLPSQQYPSQVTSGIPNLVVPASAFTGPQKDQLDSQHVIISICRPQQDTKVCLLNCPGKWTAVQLSRDITSWHSCRC